MEIKMNYYLKNVTFSLAYLNSVYRLLHQNVLEFLNINLIYTCWIKTTIQQLWDVFFRYKKLFLKFGKI